MLLRTTPAVLYIGPVAALPPDNRPSAICKTLLQAPTWLGREGLVGDAQADRRVHGGPEKALHQYASTNYAQLAQRFPEASERLVPGSIGENLSVPGWDETTVCIGDTFRLGDALIQVAQPRSPCWKIDARYEVEGMAQYIETTGLTGWYYRVLREGMVAPGAAFTLVDRVSQAVSLAAFHAVWRAHRPEVAVLDTLATHPGLTPAWVEKLRARAVRLGQLG